MAETENATRPIVAWDCDPSAERLVYTDIGEAVNGWADSIAPEPLPEFVTVHGYARMELPSATRIADAALTRVLEMLDEEFADPEDDGTARTPEMQLAALRFADAIRAYYEPWMCEPVTSETVRVADYVPSEWLAAAPAEAPHA